MFKWLTRLLLKRNFNSINIEGEFNDNGNSVLVIANHISWWDGFWIMLVNLKVIKRKFHFMMLEEQLKKHWYFQYSGGYSVKKKTRGVIESIIYTIELLKQKGNMVFMFPQGQLHSMYNYPIVFEKGIERIIKNTSPETQVLFVANLLDYFSDAKPNLFIYLESFLAKDFQQSKVEYEYNKFYEQVVNIQKSKVA
jgi:1-acyl-sn-glycerol-3-phosphate acyltransferase